MTPKDWRKVEDKVTWQGQYLKRFGKLVLAGVVVDKVLERRAKSYADPVYTTYANAFQESQTEGKNEKEMLCIRELNSAESCPDCQDYADRGWIPVSEQADLGSLQCGDYCKCLILFEDEL